jgi:ketosteroid isomerase-like protein
MDKDAYRSILTEDYLILENGELLDTESDIALMPEPDSGYDRTDTFDFRYVKIEGDIAYTVYFLKAEIVDKANGTIHKEWLESTILHRSGEEWLIALLHSTKIISPKK